MKFIFNRTFDTNRFKKGLPKHALEFNHTLDVLGAQMLHEERETATSLCLQEN